MKQPDLFGGASLSGFDPYAAPYAKGSETSKAAATSVEPDAQTWCGQVLAAIRIAQVTGLTCDEIEQQFDLRHQTASARLWDLRTRDHIVDSGRRRLTRSGRKAVVWVAPECR